MNVGHVQGGTHAGWRTLRSQAEPWFCGCYVLEGEPFHETAVKKMQPRYMTRCSDCGEKRPK